MRGDDARGFAIIEALASLVVVAMISLMLVEGVATGRRVWERLDAHAAAQDTVEGAQSLLRDRLEGLYPRTLYDAGQPYVDFAGTAGVMSFVAAQPASGGPGPLRRFTLALTSAGDLVLVSESDVQPGEAGAAQVLLRGVRAVSFAYFGPDRADPTGGWRGAWRHEPAPPRAVRVRVAFAAGDQRQWPDLIVRPRAGVGSDCLLGPNGGGCGA